MVIWLHKNVMWIAFQSQLLRRVLKENLKIGKSYLMLRILSYLMNNLLNVFHLSMFHNLFLRKT